jgi:hypothetical protein
VLQESGYALKGKGKNALIMFREAGVEIPGLQGDLEYINFDPRDLSGAFQRASEMINGLIANAGGIKVETVVQIEAIQPKESQAVERSVETALTEKTEESQSEPGSEDIEHYSKYIVATWEAIDARNWEASEREYATGLAWIRTNKPDAEVLWKCFYQRRLFLVGRGDALGQLRQLTREHETSHSPLEFLGDCLSDLHEYAEAADCYRKSAQFAPPERRALIEIDLARVLHKAKKTDQSRAILTALREADYAKDPKSQFSVLQELYSLEEDSRRSFSSFAVAELALHQTPEESNFRFSLALDYHRAEQHQMSLYHNAIISKQDTKNAGALHNLALASANNDLHVFAIQRYKSAYKLGETLAASNLAYKYLEAGMSEEATALLKEAQLKENCVPEVSGALAAIHTKIEQNQNEEDKIISRAERHREFLISFGRAYFSPPIATIHGRWNFPAGELDLQLKGRDLSGGREDRTQVQNMLANTYLPMGLSSPAKMITRIEKIVFTGKVSGRTCKFKLESTRIEEPSGWSILAGSGDSKTEGYIVFAEDGQSGEVVELKSGRPDKYFSISTVL